MSTTWLDELRRYPVPGLSCPELAVLRTIAERSDYATGRNARPSVRTIAWATALSERVARRALRALEVAGLVVAERGGGRATSRYVVVVDAVRAMIRAARRVVEGGRSDPPARSERPPTPVAPTANHNQTTTITTPPAPVIDQLALALLDAVGGGEQHTPTERAEAMATARELAAAGVTVGQVPDLLRGWRALGWSTPTLPALRRHRGALLAAAERARPGHTPRADLGAWDPAPPEVAAAELASARAVLRGAS